MSSQPPALPNGAAVAATRPAPRPGWIAAAAVRLGVTEGTVRRWIRSGRLNPICRDVYRLVFEYLDREVTAEERAEIERHIEACPGCEEHFAFDGAVLRFVRQRAPRALCPPAVQERLLARFRDRAAAEPGQ